MSASVDELRATVENLSLSPAPTVCFFFHLFNFFFKDLFCNNIIYVTGTQRLKYRLRSSYEKVSVSVTAIRR